MAMTTNDDFDDFLDHPKEPHQCWHYLDRTTRCTNETVENDYHCHLHRLKPAPIYRYPEDGFMLPDLVDRDSILRAISKIAERLGQNALDAKRAGRLLYACQLANSALDGKLREQQLAFKQKQAQQKRRVPQVSPADLGLPAHAVILSEASSSGEEAQPKDLPRVEPATAAQTVQPQTTSAPPRTNNEERTTDNDPPLTANLQLQTHNGPENAPTQGEGVPLSAPTTDQTVILSEASSQSEEAQPKSLPRVGRGDPEVPEPTTTADTVQQTKAQNPHSVR